MPRHARTCSTRGRVEYDAPPNPRKLSSFLYADIPYSGTDARGYGGGRRFDKDAFVKWAQKQKVPVYVSEYSMPEGWAEILSLEVRGMRGGRRTERVFVQSKFADEENGGRIS